MNSWLMLFLVFAQDTPSKVVVTAANDAVARENISREIGLVKEGFKVSHDEILALKAMDRLWLSAALMVESDDHMELLCRIAQARAEILMGVGRLEEAERALGRLLPDESIKHPSMKCDFASASRELLALEQKHLANDKGLEALRKQFDTGNPGQGGIRDVIVKALSTRSYNAIVDLGAMAGGTFEALVLESPEEVPTSVEADALYYLMVVDSGRAAKLLLEHWFGGPSWNARVNRAFSRAFPIRAAFLVEVDPYRNRVRHEEWIAVIESLLLDQSTRKMGLGWLTYVISLNAMTDELCETLTSILGDTNVMSEVLRIFEVDHSVPTAAPFFENALYHSDLRLRRLAATHLARLPRSLSLLSRAKDADLEVRRAVLFALGERTIEVPSVDGIGRLPDIEPRFEVEELEALGALSQDKDTGIRARVVRLIVSKPTPDLAPEVFDRFIDRFLRDPDPEVRRALATHIHFGNDTTSQVLEALAHDTDPGVLQALDKRLSLSSVCMPAIKTRLLSESSTYTFNSEDDLGVAMERLLPWAIENQLREVVQNIMLMGKAVDGGSFCESLSVLSSDRLATALTILFERDPAAYGRLHPYLRSARNLPLGAFTSISKDRRSPWRLRLKALEIVAHTDMEGAAASVKLCLDDALAESTPLLLSDTDLVRTVFGKLQGRALNGLLHVLMIEGKVPASLILEMATRYDPSAEGGIAITELILEDFFDDAPDSTPALSVAVKHLGTRPELASMERFRKILGRTQFVDTGIQSIARLRDETYIPLLIEVLRTGQDKVQKSAARALAAFPKPQSEEALLECMGTTMDDLLRLVCKESLTKIDDYRRLSSKRKLDDKDPVEELLKLINDDNFNVRIESILSLGALGGPEVAPTLIRLLREDSKPIQDASRKALEQLRSRASQFDDGRKQKPDSKASAAESPDSKK